MSSADVMYVCARACERACVLACVCARAINCSIMDTWESLYLSSVIELFSVPLKSESNAIQRKMLMFIS